MALRRRRLTIFMLIIVPILALFVVSAIYIVSQVRRVTTRLDVILVEEITRQTGRATKVGRVVASPLGAATIYDLKIANGESFSQGTLLSARRVVIRYKWRDLVWGHVAPIQSLESIRIVNPKILIERFRTGKLNIQDLITPKPGPRRPPFLGVVYASDGQVTFRDWQANVPGPKPAVTRLADLNGTFDASKAPYYIYNLDARGIGGRLGRLAMSGSIDGRKGQTSIDITANNADAAYWSPYFFRTKVFDIKQGTANVTLSATRKIINKRRVWQYAGTVGMKNGRVGVIGFKEPATNVQGNAKFAAGVFNLNISAAMAGTPLKLTGMVVGTAKPRIDLHIASASADFSRILQATQTSASLSGVKLNGHGPLTVNIIGPSDNLAYVVRASIPSASADGYRAEDINAQVTYAKGAVQVENATANALGGRVSVGGVIRVVDGVTQLALSGTAKRIKLAAIPQLSSYGAQAEASGRFSVAGTSAEPRLIADVQVSSGIIDNVAFKDAATRLTITRSRVVIHDFAAGLASGVVRVAGNVAQNQINLKVSAIGVNIAQLSKLIGVTGYAGVADFNGTVTGSFSSPAIKGNAEIFDGRFKGYAFDYARGRIVANSNQVSLENAIIRVLPAEVALHGSITGLATDTPVFNVQLNVAEAPADKMLSMLGVNANVRGTVTGNVTVRGSFPNLRAQGAVTLTDGSVEGYPIRDASANILYADGKLDLTSLVARSDGTLFDANGTIDSKGNLTFAFHANNIALSKLAASLDQPYAVLTGTADMAGTLTGTTAHPNLVATIVAKCPTINTVQFDRISTDIAWNGSSVIAANTVVAGGNGSLSIARAAYDIPKGSIRVEGGTLVDFSVPAIYTVVAESPYVKQPEQSDLRNLLSRSQRPQSGVISGKFSATGPFDALEASVNLSARDIGIAGIKGARVDLAATDRHGQIVLDTFNAVAGSLNVSAHGTVIANGMTDLEVEAYNVDLSSLTPATGPLHVAGTATVSATISGPIIAPLVNASVEMENPEIYGVHFDSLRASQITIGRDSIDISRALLSRGEQTTTFYGVIPWSWASLTVPSDRPIDLHARLDRQTLAILTIFTDAVIPDKTQPGQISASVDLTGTLRSPNLSGRVTVVNGNIGIRNMLNTFTNLQASIALQGDQATVEQLSGQSSAGGTFEVIPGGTISLRNVVSPVPGQPRGDFNLIVRANNLKLVEQNLFGYQERVNGSFETAGNGVSITGPLTQPLIAGTINIADATALISPVPAVQQAAPRNYAINPRFNLAFVLQNNVWFRNPSIRALLRGDGRFAGTLTRPQLYATLKIDSGQLKLPTQSMRITNGTITVTWDPSETGQPTLPRIVVDLSAQTSVTATSPTGTRRRYNIILSVQGPLDNLQPENVGLRSDPAGLSRTQMLAALGHFEDIFGGGELALRQQLSDIFTVAVSPLVFSRLENAFIQALGLEEFNIEYGFEQPLSVFFTRRLLGNYYFSYWRIVTGAQSITGATYSLRFSYRLKDWLDIGYASDSSRIGVLEATYSRRF